MSEKEVGIIGQLYEDRRTGKTGVLLERNDKYKTLMLEDAEGKTFSISNSAFRSNWRKAKVDEEPVQDTETTSVEPEVTEPVDTIEPSSNSESDDEPVDNTKKKSTKTKKDTAVNIRKHTPVKISDDDAVTKFENAVENSEVSVSNTKFSVVIKDICVLKAEIIGNGLFSLAMLPDLFTFCEWAGVLDPNTVKFWLNTEDKLSVTVTTYHTTIADILDIIEAEAAELNLYGYEVDENDKEDNNDEEEN